MVLLSAGVGATPVLAMLASLAADRSPREVWWIHGARNAAEHPFAGEVEEQLAALPNARSHVRYSRPEPSDRGHDAVGRVTVEVLHDLGVPLGGEFYLCGPAAWMRDLNAGLLASGVAPERLHAEIFGSAPLEGAAQPPHPPRGEPGTGPEVAFATLGPDGPLGRRVREPARARRGVRRAGRLVVPHRRLPPLRERHRGRRGRRTTRSRSRRPRTGACCCAAAGRPAPWRSSCNAAM